MLRNGMRRVPRRRLILNTINSVTQCTVMLAPRATCCHRLQQCSHLVCKVSSSTPEACGATVAVRLGQCPVRAQGSKVRLADHSDTIASSSHLAVYRQPSNRKGPFRQDG